jgi:hypothetical protein
MAGLPVRDPVGDHLLTPQNAALAVIDYQPSQFAAVDTRGSRCCPRASRGSRSADVWGRKRISTRFGQSHLPFAINRTRRSAPPTPESRR